MGQDEAIEALEKLPQPLAGIEAWWVTYRTGVREVPAWAASDEARALFPGLTSEKRQRAGARSGANGWRSRD